MLLGRPSQYRVFDSDSNGTSSARRRAPGSTAGWARCSWRSSPRRPCAWPLGPGAPWGERQGGGGGGGLASGQGRPTPVLPPVEFWGRKPSVLFFLFFRSLELGRAWEKGLSPVCDGTGSDTQAPDSGVCNDRFAGAMQRPWEGGAQQSRQMPRFTAARRIPDLSGGRTSRGVATCL